MRHIFRRFALAGAFFVGVAIAAQAAPSTTYQFPTTGWGGYAPGSVQCGVLRGVNMNVTTDQPIQISVPSATYTIDKIVVSNASVSLTTAAGGVYNAISKAGTGIVAAGQAYSTLTAAANDAAGSVLALTLNNTTAIFDLSTIYFSLTTGQGAPATADIRVYCSPQY